MSSPRPVLILGAARSGTKLLRRLLGTAPDAAVVPYGVPAVWKRGYEDHPHDALPRSDCTDASARRIREALQQLAQGPPDASFLIEKTSANTLRVPFVDAVYPNARFVHLVRDGVDVVESARRCWQARPGLAYLVRKALYLRGTGLRQGLRFVWDRLRGLGTASPSLWGPHYPGMADDVREHPLLHVCAKQWRTCIQHTLDACFLSPRSERFVRRSGARQPHGRCVRHASSSSAAGAGGPRLSAGRPGTVPLSPPPAAKVHTPVCLFHHPMSPRGHASL